MQKLKTFSPNSPAVTYVLLFLLISLVILFSIGLRKSNGALDTTGNEPELSPVVEFADWPTLSKPEWGIKLKYPPTYEIITNTTSKTELGWEGVVYVTLTTKIDEYQNLEVCKFDPEKLSDGPCLTPESFDDVSGRIKTIAIDNNEAINYHIVGGVDVSARVLVFEGRMPRIQIRGDQAGGGLESTFNQMISSIEFE